VRFRAASLLLLAATVAQADKIDDYIKGEMTKQHVPGLTLGIVKNGKLVSKRAYGVSDLELMAKTTTDDIYQLGSITKQFTAFGTMVLVEEGKVDLEAPVATYIPEAPDAWKNIKIRNLLYQNSGLKDYALVEGIGLLDNYNRQQWMDKMVKLPLDFEPGAAWSYSNTNYALLGWVIEKASGKNYTDFMMERVFKPLDMTTTRYDDPDIIIPHRAHGYLDLGHGLVRARGDGMSIHSDGSLITNLADMVKWDNALRDRKLLKSSSYDAIWSPGKLNSGRPRFYGMGWFLGLPGSTGYVGHGGNSIGYSSGIARYTDAGLTVILLSNQYSLGGEGTAKHVAELYDPNLIPKIPAESPDPNPARTEKIKAALLAWGARKIDDPALDNEITAPMKTGRAAMATGPSPLLKIEKLSFVNATGIGPDAWLTYRLGNGERWFTAQVLWTHENKLAMLSLRPDPPKG
jgi:D-alanyl-D-alanine carboxypeptidase